MLQLSAEQFRQKLAGLEAPEKNFTEDEHAMLKAVAVDMVKAMRDVFGHALDRMTVWDRISNGITVAAAKSGGRGDRFIAAMLDYIKAEPSSVVTSGVLKPVAETVCRMTPETQRQFIRTCVEFRLLLCLQAREEVQNERN